MPFPAGTPRAGRGDGPVPALPPEDVSGNAVARGVVNRFPAATNHRILLTPPLERKGKECEAYSGSG